jgi:cupin 2 domain-containing protein
MIQSKEKRTMSNNIYDRPNGSMPEELVEVLLERDDIKHLKVERIVSQQHTTDWQDQDEDEWVSLLTGIASLEFEDSIRIMHAGETLLIPAHQKHRVTRATDCIWLCIFI